MGLLALSLLPALLMAAPHPRRGSGSGFAFRHGHFGGGFRFAHRGRGFTHFGGFGHFRHRGFGFGFHARHGRSPLIIRPSHRRPFYRHRPLNYGSPYGLSYPYGSYYPYGYGYGLGYGLGGVAAVTGYTSTASPSPTIIIIQTEPQRQPARMEAQQPLYRGRGPARLQPEAERPVTRRYQTRPPAPRQERIQPQTLLVFKDRSVYSVAEYWKTDDQLCYLTSLGSGKCVRLDHLDLAFTKRLNQQRNLKFELKETQ